MSLFNAYPDTLIIFDYRGQRFQGPFHCLCCGTEISAQQFAYGRQCGYCDCGRCFTLKGGYERGHGNLWRVKPDGNIEPIIREMHVQ